MSDIEIICAASAETAEADEWETVIIEITKALVRNHLADEPGCGLGGHWSYMTRFENETFRMHPFCWCEENGCEYCFGGSPLFWHKLSGMTANYYKWLGRDTEIEAPEGLRPHDVLVSCLESIGCDLSELDKPEPCCTCNDDDGTYTVLGVEVSHWTYFEFCMTTPGWEKITTYYFPADKVCAWCNSNMQGQQQNLPT